MIGRSSSSHKAKGLVKVSVIALASRRQPTEIQEPFSTHHDQCTSGHPWPDVMLAWLPGWTTNTGKLLRINAWHDVAFGYTKLARHELLLTDDRRTFQCGNGVLPTSRGVGKANWAPGHGEDVYLAIGQLNQHPVSTASRRDVEDVAGGNRRWKGGRRERLYNVRDKNREGNALRPLRLGGFKTDHDHVTSLQFALEHDRSCTGFDDRLGPAQSLDPVSLGDCQPGQVDRIE